MGHASLPPLSAAQMEIMDVVWDRGEATVGEIWKTLAERREIARNTVQTTVTRLEQRGWLRHLEDGGVFRYVAAHPRQAAVKGLVRRLVDTAFEGSITGLVMALLEDHSLTREEADRLRARIDQAAKGREDDL